MNASIAVLRRLARRTPWRLRRLAGRMFPRRPKPLILMYHRIADLPADPWGLAVSPDRFAQQLTVLKRRRRVLPLSTFAALHARGALPPEAVAITFDDGYACNAEIAAPILEAQGLPATMFLTTGQIGTGRWFWWDALERMLLETSAPKVAVTIAGELLTFELGDLDSDDVVRGWDATQPPTSRRQAAYLDLWRALRRASEAERVSALAALHQQCGLPMTARDGFSAMDAAQVQALSRNPLIEIGAHSVTHAPLSELTPTEQRREIVDSLLACEQLAGKRPISFAYPYGDYARETLDLVRQAGFDHACTTCPGPVESSSDPYELPRIQVLNWDAGRFAAALAV